MAVITIMPKSKGETGVNCNTSTFYVKSTASKNRDQLFIIKKISEKST